MTDPEITDLLFIREAPARSDVAIVLGVAGLLVDMTELMGPSWSSESAQALYITVAPGIDHDDFDAHNTLLRDV